MAVTISTDSYRSPLSVYVRATAVTPHNTNALTGGITKGLWIGGVGNLTVTMADGVDATFNAVAAGTELRVAVSHVKATGTTATNILALY